MTPKNITLALDSLEALLAKKDFASDETPNALIGCRDALAQALIDADKLPKASPDAERIYKGLADLISVLSSLRIAPPQTNLSERCGKAGWWGFVASLLRSSIWENAELPTVEETPKPFWPYYTQILFGSFGVTSSPHDAGLHGKAYLEQLKSFVRLCESNPGSSLVRSCLEVYFALGACDHLAQVPINIRELLSLRTRLIQLREEKTHSPRLIPLPIVDRKTKIGFIAPSTANTRQVRLVAPFIDSLDQTKFEVALFVFEKPESEFLELWQKKDIAVELLPEKTQAAQAMLRERDFDILVFATDILKANDRVASVMSARSATLQLCIDASCFGLGTQNTDFEIHWDGHYEPTGTTTHRKVLLPYCGFVPVQGVELKPPTREWSREALGIAEKDHVFISFAPFSSIHTKLAETWAGILAQVPGSKLIVQSFLPEDTDQNRAALAYGILHDAFEKNGIDPSRLLFGYESFDRLSDFQQLMQIADTYLDTANGYGDEGAVMALNLGKALVTLPPLPGRSSVVQTLLERCDCAQFVCKDLIDYTQAGVSLGLNTLTEKPWTAIKGHAKALFDENAMGIAWGEMLNLTYDEMVKLGGNKASASDKILSFDADLDIPATLSMAEWLLNADLTQDAEKQLLDVLKLEPTNPSAITLLRGIYAKSGLNKKLIQSLLTAVDQQSKRSDLWFSLALAFRAEGMDKEFFDSISVSLGIDPMNADAWSELITAAELIGDHALLADIKKQISPLAIQDQRLIDFLTKES